MKAIIVAATAVALNGLTACGAPVPVPLRLRWTAMS